jgi:hypothetical protein
MAYLDRRNQECKQLLVESRRTKAEQQEQKYKQQL